MLSRLPSNLQRSTPKVLKLQFVRNYYHANNEMNSFTNPEDLGFPVVQNLDKNKQLLTVEECEKIYRNQFRMESYRPAMLRKFMKVNGCSRTDFKSTDFPMWQKAFGNQLNTTITFDQNTNNLVASAQCIRFKSIDGNEEFVFGGMLWTREEYRGKVLLASVTAKCISDGFGRDVSVGSLLKSSVNFWEKLTGNEAQYSHEYFISYYDVKDFKDPDLKFNDIIVKNAHEVPDEDITNFDNTVFEFERKNFMLEHLRDPDGFGRVAYNSKGDVIGIGSVTIYPSGELVISPLYADNTQTAQAIFQSILKEIPLKEDGKLWRFQVRSTNVFKDSYEWIKPFLTCELNRKPLARLAYHQYMPEGLKFEKIFINAPPTCVPC